MTSGGVRAHWLPEFEWLITSPDAMFSSAALKRMHNSISKEVGRQVIKEHKRDNLRDHFLAGNWTRYQHKKRQPEYVKRKRSPIDLVKTGKTKRHMQSQNPNVRISGSADKEMTIRLFLSYPFPVSTKADNREGVSIDDMSTEIGRWTIKQVVWAAERYQQLYAEKLLERLSKRPKLRKKVGGAAETILSILGS